MQNEIAQELEENMDECLYNLPRKRFFFKYDYNPDATKERLVNLTTKKVK